MMNLRICNQILFPKFQEFQPIEVKRYGDWTLFNLIPKVDENCLMSKILRYSFNSNVPMRAKECQKLATKTGSLSYDYDNMITAEGDLDHLALFADIEPISFEDALKS